MSAPIIPELLDLFPDTVTVEEPSAFDKFGRPTGYAAARTAPARILGNIRKVTAPDGTEKVSTLTVLLGGVFNVTIHARVTLPTRFPQRQPAIITVHQATDENGPHHERIYF